MRKALNENPTVQIAVLGVFGVVFAIILFMTVLSGDDSGGEGAAGEPAAGAAAPAADAGAAAAPSPSATPAPTESPAPAPSAPAPQASAPGADPASGLSPSKGLPEDVLVAYARNKAIALIVYDPGAISDDQLKADVKRLGSRDDVEVFTVKAKNVAEYGRITGGVGVSQTPALIVIRPRDKSGEVRTATVEYGFRGPKSVELALEDALYTGDTRSASP